MKNPPEITAIVTRTGLSSNPAGLLDAGVRPDETLLVGLVLDGRRIAWGKCVPRLRTPFGALERQYPGPFLAAEAEAAIQAHMAPLLVGKPLAQFRPLAAALDTLTETVAVEPDVAAVETVEEAVVYSRRGLFTGQSGRVRSQPPAETEKKDITRPVHPAIRQGVSQALLAAVAMAGDTSASAVLAAEYGEELAGAPIPIQIAIQKGQSLALYPQVGALSYAAGGEDPGSEFGDDAGKLQRFVRLLSDRVAAAMPRPPLIVLDVQGGLGRLYGNEPASMGKILGALYGLEQAAQPCPLCVQDPVLMEDPAGQVTALRKLREYIQMRRMSMQIAAGEWMHNREHLHRCLNEQAVDSIFITLPALGTLDRVMRVAQRCRDHGVKVVLGGEPVTALVPVALATNAGRVAVPPHLPAGAGITTLYEEMLRETTQF
jgi:methylaspartate ammonia-lyase